MKRPDRIFILILVQILAAISSDSIGQQNWTLSAISIPEQMNISLSNQNMTLLNPWSHVNEKVLFRLEGDRVVYDEESFGIKSTPLVEYWYLDVNDMSMRRAYAHEFEVLWIDESGIAGVDTVGRNLTHISFDGTVLFDSPLSEVHRIILTSKSNYRHIPYIFSPTRERLAILLDDGGLTTVIVHNIADTSVREYVCDTCGILPREWTRDDRVMWLSPHELVMSIKNPEGMEYRASMFLLDLRDEAFRPIYAETQNVEEVFGIYHGTLLGQFSDGSLFISSIDRSGEVVNLANIHVIGTFNVELRDAILASPSQIIGFREGPYFGRPPLFLISRTE